MTVYRQYSTLLRAAPGSRNYTFPLPPDWTDYAACQDEDPALFYGKGSNVAKAKAICRSCLVRDECLDLALSHESLGRATNHFGYGVYGGLTAPERRVLLREQAEGPRTCLLPGCDQPVTGPGNQRFCSREHTIRMKHLRAALRRTA